MRKFISLISLVFALSFLISAQDANDSIQKDSEFFYQDKGLKVYPNPVRQGSLLYVQHSFNKDEMLNFGLYDINGALIYYKHEVAVHNQRLAISTDNMPPSTYILYLRVGDKFNRQKIVILN